jgi:hypothetical protein
MIRLIRCQGAVTNPSPEATPLPRFRAVSARRSLVFGRPSDDSQDSCVLSVASQLLLSLEKFLCPCPSHTTQTLPLLWTDVVGGSPIVWLH